MAILDRLKWIKKNSTKTSFFKYLEETFLELHQMINYTEFIKILNEYFSLAFHYNNINRVSEEE